MSFTRLRVNPRLPAPINVILAPIAYTSLALLNQLSLHSTIIKRRTLSNIGFDLPLPQRDSEPVKTGDISFLRQARLWRE
jgi:hypothetical protein